MVTYHPAPQRPATRSVNPPPLPRWSIGLTMLMAAFNLLGAVGGGLVRLGTLPAQTFGPTGTQAIVGHGAVMMAGFFGALIALERVVALRRGLWVPVLSALGGWLAWGAGLWVAAQTLWIASALGLVWIYFWAGSHRTMSLPLAVEGSGALALLIGNIAFTSGQIEAARIAWSAFLVLTIAGERRELTRLVKLPAWGVQGFVVVWAATGAAALAALRWPNIATTTWWGATGALALWLLRFDVATRQWRARGWAGHTALCLVVGYVWLALAAVAGLAQQTVAWHLLWLGFVMAMVFGHAPILLPALAGWRPEPTRWGLLPLAVLGVSLALRAVATATGNDAGLALAGAGHALAFVLFGAVMVRAVRRGHRSAV